MSSKKSASILVVMPVYNAMPYLVEAVASVLNQTYTSYLFLCIDDSSTDDSFEYLASQKDERIHIVQQEHSGPVAAMNTALEFAIQNEIQYIARMDADDIMHPRRLELQLNEIQSNPLVAAVSCNCNYIDTHGRIIGSSTVPITSKRITWEIQHGLRGLVQGACLFRTESLAKINGYRQQIPQAEDTDLFLRLSDYYQFSNVKEFLYQIRINPESFSIRNLEKNTLYHQYALHCSKCRTRGFSEPRFDDYLLSRGIIDKFDYYHELLFLSLWRKGMQESNILLKILAAVISPKRLIARIGRVLETR